MRSFYVLGTPRSRTAWLAEWLSSPGRRCEHEPSKGWRSMDDLWMYVQGEGACASDSLLTLRWRHILAIDPDARIVVVMRPLTDVIASFKARGLWHPGLLTMLLRVEQEVRAMQEVHPVLMVPFAALGLRSVCEAVYEHCHGRSSPAGHWEMWGRRHVHADLSSVMAAAAANADGLRRVYPELVEAA